MNAELRAHLRFTRQEKPTLYGIVATVVALHVAGWGLFVYYNSQPEFQGMVDGLEAKLRANPRNAEGWIMLMRSRMSLGETAKARTAYRNAQAAFASDDPTRAQIDAAAQTLGIR